MFALDLSVNLGSGCNDNELSITYKLFNKSTGHQSILLDKFGWILVIPLISIDLISIGHNKIDVIIESDSVNSEFIHIHFNVKEVSHVNLLVS